MMLKCKKYQELHTEYTRWAKQINSLKEKCKIKMTRGKKGIIPKNLTALLRTKKQLKVTGKTNTRISRKRTNCNNGTVRYGTYKRSQKRNLQQKPE